MKKTLALVWRWRTGKRPVPRRIARIVELLQLKE